MADQKGALPVKRLAGGGIAAFMLIVGWVAGSHVAAQGAPSRQQGAAAQNVTTPRTADGHPDLSGLYVLGAAGAAGPARSDDQGNVSVLLNTRDDNPITFERDSSLVKRANPNVPVYKPELWEKLQALDDDAARQDPSIYSCMPLGLPRMGPPSQIVQTPKQLIFLYQVGMASGASGNTFRVIPTDGRPLPPKDTWEGTWQGRSVGHWEGDTMVIESVDINDESWLDNQGYFHSADMKVTERLTRQGNAVRYEVTVEDPQVLMKPWVMNTRILTANTDPMALLEEALPCRERDFDHLVTKEHH
jgi:hypothetical protein